MSLADLAALDRANERRCDMEAFLAAHPEYRVSRVVIPTRHLLDGARYVSSVDTDLRTQRLTPTERPSQP